MLFRSSRLTLALRSALVIDVRLRWRGSHPELSFFPFFWRRLLIIHLLLLSISSAQMWKLCISSTTTQPEIPTNIRSYGVLSTIPDITPTTHEHFVFSEYPGYPDDQASSITPMFFFQHIHILAHISVHRTGRHLHSGTISHQL